MNKQERVALAIKEVVSKMMDRVMENVLVNDPFVKEKHHASKPLYAALVPDEIFKGSHFERRFVTPFGSVWERLAQVVAIEAHGNCVMRYTINGTVALGRLRRIQAVLNRSSNENYEFDWEKEITYILAARGQPLPVTVNYDISINSNQIEGHLVFELEESKSDIYQIGESKEKILKLLVMSV